MASDDREARIKLNEFLIERNTARIKVIDLQEKQTRILLASAKVAAYDSQVDKRTDVATCSNAEFERHMRSRNRIDRAYVKICKLAVYYNVSGIKNLTLKVGNEFLNFWVWGEYNGIPFSLEDINLLEKVKTQSIDRFIAATRKCDRVLYALERIVSGSYATGDAMRAIEKTTDIKLANYAADAAWVDFEVLQPDYTTEHALNAGFNPKQRQFHRTPQPGDEVKITTIRINTYKTFDQKLESFAPIPDRIFIVFIVEEIPPPDVA